MTEEISEEPKFGLFEMQQEVDELRARLMGYEFMMRRMRQRMGILERIFMMLFDDQEMIVNKIIDKFKSEKRNERKPK